MTSGEYALPGKATMLLMWKLSIITNIKLSMTTPYIHPGEILLEEFLNPLSLSQYRLAKDIHVPPRRINEIILGKRAISADTALRLGKYFGTTPEFWVNLQSYYDLSRASEALATELKNNVVEYAMAVRETPALYKKSCS